MTKEERKEYHHQWYLKNREKYLKKKKKYRQEHKEERAEYNKQYRQEHKEHVFEYMQKFRQTQIGRAINLLSGYRRSDKKYNRGECTITGEWIVDNIFSKPCVHCGETDWHKLGCNRIDNNLPHTPDNVEPCCFPCNIKLLEMEHSNDGRFVKKTK